MKQLDGDDYDAYVPQLSLSNDGNELALTDPTWGVIMFHFTFETNKWEKQTTKTATFAATTIDYWIESVDMDDAGNLVAFSAFEGMNQNYTNIVQVVDFSSHNNNSGTEVFVRNYPDFQVGIAVAVSDDGQVATIVASREDVDDTVAWFDDVDYVGAMTVIAKNPNGTWGIVGKGTKAENVGVPGNFVTLSGDGRIAAVGSDNVVAFYGIANLPTSHNATGTTNTSTTSGGSSFSICTPFSNATLDAHAGDIDKLPKQPDQHTLSLAMSASGSVVAVGIDSSDDENRGMARVFAWDCDLQAYAQLGQDLFGTDEFDGFGQSVDLSADGMTLVVGANQPPPGKSGYVEVYSFAAEEGMWKLVGKRLDNMRNLVEDVGRQVRISDDGSTVVISGSIVEQLEDGWDATGSFIRVVENVNGVWKSKGDALVSSIEYDDYGANVRISRSGDGEMLVVTGSYSTFLAKVYEFDGEKKNWTETVIPPIKASTDNGDGDGDDDEDTFDEYYENYFSGVDIALNDNGVFMAVAGTKYTQEDGFSVVRVLTRNATTGNWTMLRDPIDYDDDYMPSSVDISSDGQKLAVGINIHSDESTD